MFHWNPTKPWIQQVFGWTTQIIILCPAEQLIDENSLNIQNKYPSPENRRYSVPEPAGPHSDQQSEKFKRSRNTSFYHVCQQTTIRYTTPDRRPHKSTCQKNIWYWLLCKFIGFYLYIDCYVWESSQIKYFWYSLCFLKHGELAEW